MERHPAAVTAILSAVGYAPIAGTLLGIVPGRVFPGLSFPQMNLLPDAIAVVNTVSIPVIAVGRRWIRHGEVRKHMAAMITSFGLILVFLIIHLAKIGNGGTREFVGLAFAYYPCLMMLTIHVILSTISMSTVLCALTLGTTRPERELRTETLYRKVGHIAVGAWFVSLALGVVACLLFNYMYS